MAGKEDPPAGKQDEVTLTLSEKEPPPPSPAAPSEGAAAAVAAAAAETKLVEMPMGHLRWILAQRPENHPTPCIEDYELYRTHDPVKPPPGFSQRSIDVRRELFTSLFASLRESHREFFEYQASVRDEFEKDGRVMVAEQALGTRDDWQREIDEIWARAAEDYARDHPDEVDDEDYEDYDDYEDDED